jgi:hypothetical protein
MPAWRAVQTKPLLEPLTDRSLREIAVPTFFPRRQVRLHTVGSPIVERAYFPGYLFADLEDRHLSELRCVRGMVMVLGTLPIPDPVISKLIARADNQGIIAEPLGPGQAYRLRKPGALGNIIATVEHLDGRNRARVLIRLFGLDRPALVRIGDLDTTDPILAERRTHV